MIYHAYIVFNFKSGKLHCSFPEFPNYGSTINNLTELSDIFHDILKEYLSHELDKRHLPVPIPLDELFYKPQYQKGIWASVQLNIHQLKKVL